MFSRLFGKKDKEGKNNASAEQASEDSYAQKRENATEAMVTIKNSIRDLEKKVKDLTANSECNLREAAELKKKNPNDPRIKQLLTKVKKDRDNIQKYNSVLLKQEANLTAMDDAAFISEMYEIMEKTKLAMESAVSGINDKLREIMDEIEDLKQDISEVMDLFVSNDAEEDDLGDLEGELDAMIADGVMNQPEMALPSAPTHLVAEPEKPAEDDLDAMLAELAVLSVCF